MQLNTLSFVDCRSVTTCSSDFISGSPMSVFQEGHWIIMLYPHLCTKPSARTTIKRILISSVSHKHLHSHRAHPPHSSCAHTHGHVHAHFPEHTRTGERGRGSGGERSGREDHVKAERSFLHTKIAARTATVGDSLMEYVRVRCARVSVRGSVAGIE